jgi:hypothetical protein
VKLYFSIQQKRLGRLLKSSGANPIAALILVFIGFSAITYGLFINIEKAPIIYVAIAVSLLFTLSEAKRNHFLKNCFSRITYLKIRLVENALVITPFLIGALVFKVFLWLPALLAVAAVGSFYVINKSVNLTIPTPYYKKPFEFIIGFRKTIIAFIVSYALTIIAIKVENYGLGVFALAIQMLALTFFYMNGSEPHIYVWIHSKTPKQFLNHKLKTGLIQSLFLSLPILIIMSILNPGFLWINLTVFVLGLLYLITAILFKYAYYPSMTMVQEMGFVACLFTPPILLVAIPLLYIKATKNLNTYLL